MTKKFGLLLLCLLLAGCSQKPETKELSLNAYLLQHTALGAGELRAYMQNESLLSMFSPSAETHEVIQDLEANLQGEPETAMILKFAPEAINNIVKVSGSEMNLTEQEEAYLSRRFIRAIPPMINGRSGTEMMIATSVIESTKSSLSHSELAEDTAVILLYGDGYGIYAAFSPSEDGTVLISASCIKFLEDVGIDEMEQLYGIMEELLDVKIFDVSYIEKQEMEALMLPDGGNHD